MDTCDSFFWNDTLRISSGTYIIPATDSLNCDSILELTINQNYTTNSDTTVCDEFIWGTDTFTVSGPQTKTFELDTGCDSTHTFNVTVNSGDYTLSEETACASYLWPTNQIEYTQSGIYQFEYTNDDN